MTRAELEAEAKQLGLKVRAAFLDDWQENVLFVAVAIVIGYGAGYFRIFGP